MFWKLLLLFTLVPLVELVILVKLSQWTGSVLLTIGIVVGTGAAGAALAKRQGLKVLDLIRRDLSAGILPGDRILDGMLLLVAAAFLITPGLLTDVSGLLLLIPWVRTCARNGLKRWMKRRMAGGSVVSVHVDETRLPGGED